MRPLQLWRSRGPSVFGPLQLPQMAVVFFAGHRGKLIVLPRTSWQNLRGEGKKSGEWDGWNIGGAVTGDGEGTGEERKGIGIHPTQTFQPWLRVFMWTELNRLEVTGSSRPSSLVTTILRVDWLQRNYRTVGARLVLDTGMPMRLFTTEFTNWSSADARFTKYLKIYHKIISCLS